VGKIIDSDGKKIVFLNLQLLFVHIAALKGLK
jgi:hypothetical protein